jgi:opacity protein-like surface antigen
VAFPVGSLHDFTNAVSGVGFEFIVRYFALPQLSVGGSADFQSFAASQPRSTYQVDNGALTATAYNRVQIASLRASAHYYLLKNGPVLPYAGASVGIGWATFQSSAADLALYDNQASVLLGGELGTLFPLDNSSLALMTGVRYSALPAADFLSVSNVQSLSLQFGLLTL